MFQGAGSRGGRKRVGANSLSTPISIANGGTGQNAQTAAFDALDPLTTKGDLIGNDGTHSVRVAVGANNTLPIASSAATPGWAWGVPRASYLSTCYLPLTTVIGGVPDLVWDGDDNLIPTEIPL